MILLIDTARESVRVGLYNENGEAQSERSLLLTSSLSQQLLQEINSLFLKHHVSCRNIRGILCIKGPGHFTSIRIGVVTANTLAFALNVPIIGVLREHELQGLKQLREGKSDASVTPMYDAMPDIR